MSQAQRQRQVAITANQVAKEEETARLDAFYATRDAAAIRPDERRLLVLHRGLNGFCSSRLDGEVGVEELDQELKEVDVEGLRKEETVEDEVELLFQPTCEDLHARK
ncbi:hypothetical protein HO173_003164 [Letharia columbiana]|uniref:Uncharacterized protein n=1 Tax=Letharia columbiana TaxID=112416 RepID=A0A8H6G181_9LECA|nr:uncharacterized protein HO173_003164 [Letharia columbiana]KAF6238658.1 hypothetical protein HO173_003164 [Letharia columbiana]